MIAAETRPGCRRNNEGGGREGRINQPRWTCGQRHQRTEPTCGRRPGHLPDRTGQAAASGEGAHAGRRRDRRGRRRLPMVEVDSNLELIGPHGSLTLLDAFEGRRQLIAYYFMWHTGHPAAEQCEGCTWVTSQVAELSYLHSRDITLAVLCQGPYGESSATATSWAGTCRGTQHAPPSTRSSSGVKSGCSISC